MTDEMYYSNPGCGLPMLQQYRSVGGPAQNGPAGIDYDEAVGMAILFGVIGAVTVGMGSSSRLSGSVKGFVAMGAVGGLTSMGAQMLRRGNC